jgi:tetratricopeptide (TPR) repeat protein
MTKKKLTVGLSLLLGILGLQPVWAQNQTPRPTAPPIAAPTPKLSSILAGNLKQQNITVPRERREQAYAKLLEGQRYMWGMDRVRTQAALTNAARAAGQSLQKAVELDPTLAEGYTALAELVLRVPPFDFEEAVWLADMAVKIQPDNFGSRRILARIYTMNSQFRSENFNSEFVRRAIAEWKEVARLDPRNAEAWAFLSELYDKTNQSKERIEALQNWLSSATPLDTRYYRGIMGREANLAPDSASLKLGAALIKANRAAEAVEILSRAVADDPEDDEAISLLRQALDIGGGGSSKVVLEALEQAVYANPDNIALIRLLAQIQARMGKTDDAVKSLRASIAKLADRDKNSAAELQVSLGDIYMEANQTDEAVAAYESALKTQGIGSGSLIGEDEREFATVVFHKLIQAYKNAGRVNDAKAAIDRARRLLGKDDLFADGQLISLHRETGKSQEALQIVRALRSRIKDDYSLLRLEALILTEMGRVDEGVGLIKSLIGGGKAMVVPSLMYDDFSNYIYISSLYNQAKRGKEAILNAQKAYDIAESQEKKQIADLTLASARFTSGEFKAAEDILRNLLKQYPSNPIALNNLGYFLLELDRNLEEALELIKQAVEIDPTNSSYLDSLGWAYFKLGKLNEAEIYLKEAISNDSTSATIHEHLGDVYQKQGRIELARKSWQRAMSLASDPDSGNRLKNKLSKTEK